MSFLFTLAIGGIIRQINKVQSCLKLRRLAKRRLDRNSRIYYLAMDFNINGYLSSTYMLAVILNCTNGRYPQLSKVHVSLYYS